MIGIKISKENQTIQDESDKQYVDTTTPLFKPYLESEDARYYNGTDLSPGLILTNSFKIHHGLGYIPMFFLYADRNSQSNRKIVLNSDTSFPGQTLLWTCRADEQDIICFVSGGPSITGIFGYNYIIFYDKVG